MNRTRRYYEIGWLSPTHSEVQQKLQITFSENVDFIRANIVPDNKAYADVVMSRNTKNGIIKKVIVFGDSIIRGIRVRDFHQQVKNGYAKFKSFPGWNSKEMLHYIEPTLETGFYDI